MASETDIHDDMKVMYISTFKIQNSFNIACIDSIFCCILVHYDFVVFFSNFDVIDWGSEMF